MAISKTIKGVTVSIVAGGKICKEYEDPHDETEHEFPNRTVLRYIESFSDTNYSILNEVSLRYKLKSSLEFVVQVDGYTLPKPLLFVRSEKKGDWSRKLDGKPQVDRRGRQWEKPFKFSPLSIVDEYDKDRAKRDAKAPKKIGEIKITVRRRQTKYETHWETCGDDNDTNLEIAEKAIKGQALSHGTEFGDAVQATKRTKLFHTTNQRGNREPAAVFIFRYRSREALEAEHIVPRTRLPTPPRSPTPDPLLGKSDEEIREIARSSLYEKKVDMRKVKMEPRENGNGPVKFTNDDEILTIDITGHKPVFIREPKPPKETVDLR